MDLGSFDGATIVTLLLTIAFTAWAGVVRWGVQKISDQLNDIGDDLKTESAKLNQYIVQTETRLAILEDRVINND